MKNLGAFFSKLREQSELSIEDVCKNVEELKPETLTAFEKGSTPIPLSTVMALANVLNADPADVLSLITEDAQLAAMMMDTEQSVASATSGKKRGDVH